MKEPTYYLSKGELGSALVAATAQMVKSYEETHESFNVLDTFLSSATGQLEGDTWDAVFSNLGSYADCLQYAEKLEQIITEANQEYTKILEDFLGTDDSLNSDDLPVLIAEKEAIENEIARLEAENAQLALVPEIIMECVGYDENDNPVYDWVRNPAYDAAQDKIAENNTRIETELLPDLNEHNRKIDKIYELRLLMAELDKRLDAVKEKVDNYLDRISDLMNSITEKWYTKPSDEVLRDEYDNLETYEGRMNYIYDKLTQVYGYSEWGAKAIIAHMIKENGTLEADRFQGGGGPNAGYGLIQWEYQKYGGWSNRAQKMEDWCSEMGLDHTTIDGQLAYLDYEIPQIAKYYNVNLYQELQNATEDDYLGVGTRFGTYIIGCYSGSSYNRLEDGNTKYKLFPIIDNREKVPDMLASASTPKLDSVGTGSLAAALGTESTTGEFSSLATAGAGAAATVAQATASKTSKNPFEDYKLAPDGTPIPGAKSDPVVWPEGSVNPDGTPMTSAQLQERNNPSAKSEEIDPSNFVTIPGYGTTDGKGHLVTEEYHLNSDDARRAAEEQAAKDAAIDRALAMGKEAVAKEAQGMSADQIGNEALHPELVQNSPIKPGMTDEEAALAIGAEAIKNEQAGMSADEIAEIATARSQEHNQNKDNLSWKDSDKSLKDYFGIDKTKDEVPPPTEPPADNTPPGGGDSGGAIPQRNNKPKVEEPIEEEPEQIVSEVVTPAEPTTNSNYGYKQETTITPKSEEIKIESQKVELPDETPTIVEETPIITDLAANQSAAKNNNDWVKKILAGAGVSAAAAGAIGIPLYDANKKKKERDSEKEKENNS